MTAKTRRIAAIRRKFTLVGVDPGRRAGMILVGVNDIFGCLAQMPAALCWGVQHFYASPWRGRGWINRKFVSIVSIVVSYRGNETVRRLGHVRTESMPLDDENARHADQGLVDINTIALKATIRGSVSWRYPMPVS